MRKHLSNAWYGLLDYAAYPITMLVVAPVLLRHLQTSGYGILVFSMALVNTGAIVASGFGDASIQQIAAARAESNWTAIQNTIRGTLGIHLALGTSVMILGIKLSPWIARHMTTGEPATLATCIRVLYVSSALVLLRTIETVAVSMQRAFECYADAVRISATMRLLTLVVAAALASAGSSIDSIFYAIGFMSLIGTALQMLAVARKVSFSCLVPSFKGREVRTVLVYGSFTWLQAVGGVLFSQADRLVVGVAMGSTAVAAYSLAAQLAQPIAGSTASALHFLFPHFAHRATHVRADALKGPLLGALRWNAAMVSLEAVPLLLLGRSILTIWAGKQNADLAGRILPLLVVGSALAALSVTGNYVMLALGRVRIATLITVGTGCLMLAAATPAMTTWGTEGMAVMRLLMGGASLLVYIPLWRVLSADQHRAPAVVIATSTPGSVRQ